MSSNNMQIGCTKTDTVAHSRRDPKSSICRPVSSATSLTAASSGNSPGSIWPPGGSQASTLLCHKSKVELPSTTKVVAVKSRVIRSKFNPQELLVVSATLIVIFEKITASS